jgi:hypothetical protein
MSLLTTSNWAVTLRDKNNDVDLRGLATIRWSTRQAGFHLLRPILKLASGKWLIGDKTSALTTDFVESEFNLADVRWRELDITNIVGRPGSEVVRQSRPEPGRGDWFHRHDAGSRPRIWWRFARQLDSGDREAGPRTGRLAIGFRPRP